jgi:mercuric ion transport protein
MNPAAPQRRSFGLQYVSLFTSVGTLLCCALPSLLVLFGLGATVASLLSAAPWLVMLSQHKNWTFATAGILIGLNITYVYKIAPRLRQQACEAGDDACASASRISTTVLWVSAALFGIAVFVAYVLGPVFVWLDSSR